MTEQIENEPTRHGKLWSLLDWSFWGAGMGDVFREPLADTMLAAVPAETVAQAEQIMADFIERRKIEKTGVTVYQEQRDKLAAYEALELGDPDGRVSASCDDPEHPTWLRRPDDTRGCPWCQITDLEEQRERRRLRLIALQNDALDMRGSLSPNGEDRKVPFPLGETLTPAVDWLIARVTELEGELAAAKERHKQGLRRADEHLREMNAELQRYADGKEAPVLWSVYNKMHGRALRAEASANKLAADAAALDQVQEIVRRLTAHAVGFRDVLDDTDRGPWAKTVGADITALSAALDASPDRLALPWAHVMPDDDLHEFLGDLVSAAIDRWRSAPDVPDREILANVEKVCANWSTPGQGQRSDESEAGAA
jgi:hypothetical protein